MVHRPLKISTGVTCNLIFYVKLSQKLDQLLWGEGKGSSVHKGLFFIRCNFLFKGQREEVQRPNQIKLPKDFDVHFPIYPW